MSVRHLVDRGIEVRRQIKALQKELKDIEEKLESQGLNEPHEDLKDAEREGRRWLARGSELIVPVVFTADKLMQSFKLNSATHQSIKTAAGDLLKEFYGLTQTFETKFDDGKKFRKVADEVMGSKAPTFITACLARDKHGVPKSDIKVCWDDGEPAEGVRAE
jgi:hypothetical protein